MRVMRIKVLTIRIVRIIIKSEKQRKEGEKL